MNTILTGLDHLRASLLKSTLSYKYFRRIFLSRANRLMVFVCFSLIFNFLLSLTIPLWMLVLGPLIYGTTHLFASFRYIPKAITQNEFQQRRITRMICYSVLLIGAIRALQLKYSIPNFIGLYNFWEWLVLFVVFFFTVCVFKFKIAAYKTSLIAFLLLIICSLNLPLETAAIIMLSHNFIPFAYWLKLTKSSSEKNVVLLTLGLFSAIHLLYLFGFTDSPAQHLYFSIFDFSPTFDPLTVAKQIFPTSNNYLLLERAIPMFAFSQAFHYFLWIKVIPEQSIQQEIPLSFRNSKKEVIKDLGPVISYTAIALSLALIGLMFFLSPILLRDMYIAIASAHGFAEMAGLPFLLSKNIRSA